MARPYGTGNSTGHFGMWLGMEDRAEPKQLHQKPRHVFPMTGQGMCRTGPRGPFLRDPEMPYYKFLKELQHGQEGQA